MRMKMTILMTRMIVTALGSSAMMAEIAARMTERAEQASIMWMARAISATIARVAMGLTGLTMGLTGLAMGLTELMKATGPSASLAEEAVGLAKEAGPAALLAKWMRKLFSATRIAGLAKVARVARVPIAAQEKEQRCVVLAAIKAR
jgi:hypothetical protein